MSSRPVRVLHAVRIMNRGGVETWLMHVLRRMDPRRLQMDFLVHSPGIGEYDDEIRAHGGNLVRCPLPLWSRSYRRRIGHILQSHGPYDVFHSHVHHFSGYLLRLAYKYGVPTRIAHSHLDSAHIDRSAHWLRRCYLRWAGASIRDHATSLTAVSGLAAMITP